MDQDESLLFEARRFFEVGNLSEADFAYAKVLRKCPNHLEALNFRALHALNSGRVIEALSVLRHALLLAPEDVAVRQHFGMALVAAGQHQEAIGVLSELLLEHPSLYIARLHLGNAQEALGLGLDAVASYFGAISTAQMQGRWLGVKAIPNGLRARVLHAMGVINIGRAAHFDRLLEPLRKTYGPSSLRRVEVALEGYLGDVRIDYADSRQKPLFLYFPGLSAKPVHARSNFPWLAALEQQTASIRSELHAVLDKPEGVQPFNRYGSQEEQSRYLRGGKSGPNWDAYFFYRHGKRIAENAERCPATMASLERLPLVHIAAHAPEICFSMLTPGTHILAHRGVTNTRLVAHLPLIVPSGDCMLRTAAEDHHWREGQAFVFDDTYEHEAWNRTDSLRVILLMDFWHPELDQAERAALSELVAGIGDFNSAAGLVSGKTPHSDGRT